MDLSSDAQASDHCGHSGDSFASWIDFGMFSGAVEVCMADSIWSEASLVVSIGS